LYLSFSFANSLYCLFVAHYCLFSSSSQAIAKNIANQTSKSFFVYEIIVVCSLVVARTTKTNAIAIIVAAIFIVANEIECLN